MTIGEVVYIPQRNEYGFVHEVTPDGRVKYVNVLNRRTGQFELVEVIDLIIEAVGIIKRFIVIIKLLFAKKTPDAKN